MNEAVVAIRYAKGLAGAAADAGQVREVRGDLELLNDILGHGEGGRGVPRLPEILHTPTATVKEKTDLADRVLEKLGTGNIIAGFLNVLIARNRVGIMPHIVRAYNAVADGLTGETTATVETARPLTDRQRVDLAAALAKAAGRAVHLQARVEPALVGGVRVQMGDLQIDATLLGRLQRMEALLK